MSYVLIGLLLTYFAGAVVVFTLSLLALKGLMVDDGDPWLIAGRYAAAIFLAIFWPFLWQFFSVLALLAGLILAFRLIPWPWFRST